MVDFDRRRCVTPVPGYAPGSVSTGFGSRACSPQLDINLSVRGLLDRKSY